MNTDQYEEMELQLRQAARQALQRHRSKVESEIFIGRRWLPGTQDDGDALRPVFWSYNECSTIIDCIRIPNVNCDHPHAVSIVGSELVQCLAEWGLPWSGR